MDVVYLLLILIFFVASAWLTRAFEMLRKSP
jgi:hypothetical protein